MKQSEFVVNFERIRIVLVETSHPGNIGSCARAMKNMGLSSLYLVNPKHFPHSQAEELAAGSEDVLQKAMVVKELREALIGCQVVFMTSARARSIGLTGVTPCEMAKLVVETHAKQTIALVFGREQSGLTNEELLLGQYHVVIPANPIYSSLNIAQAVQILTYELRMKALLPIANANTMSDELASHDACERFYEHLTNVLLQIGFLKPSAPRRLMQRFRRLFGRTQLEKMEVDLLRGVLSRVECHLRESKCE